MPRGRPLVDLTERPQHAQHRISAEAGKPGGNNGIPDTTIDLLRGVDTLALDGLRLSPPHPTHFTIGEAIEVAGKIGPRLTYLIHLTHDIDHAPLEATLPPNVRLAYDGLPLTVE